MIKVKKLASIMITLAVMLMFFAFGVSVLNGSEKAHAYDNTTDLLEVLDGAAASLEENNPGLRFTAEIKSAEVLDAVYNQDGSFKGNARVGMIIVPSQIIDKCENNSVGAPDYYNYIKNLIGAENMGHAAVDFTKAMLCAEDGNDGRVLMKAEVSDFEDGSGIQYSYQAVAYYTPDGINYYYSGVKDSNIRTVEQVAMAALCTGDYLESTPGFTALINSVKLSQEVKGTSGDTIMYSSSDGLIYLSENLANKKINKVTSLDGVSVYYQNEIWSTNDFVLTDNQNNNNVVLEKYVLVYDENDQTYFATIKSYTKVLTSLEDFASTFIRGTGSPVTVVGSYALACDVGSSANDDLIGIVGTVDCVNNFNGYFDGLGHTVRFHTAQAYNYYGDTKSGNTIVKYGNPFGLFGRYVCGTVKNLNFDVNFKANKVGAGLLGQQCDAQGNIGPALFENINVHIYQMTYWGTKPTIADGELGGILFGNSGWSATTFRNIIIEVETENYSDGWSYNLIAKTPGNLVPTVENVYVIPHGTHYDPNLGGSKPVVKDIPSYSTFADLKNANVLGGFKTWNISGDHPTVKTQNFTMYALETGSPLLYSSEDDKLYFPEDLGVTIYDVRSIESKDGATVYYEDNEWRSDLSVSNPASNTVESHDVWIYTTNGKFYSATINSYTKVFSSLNDFKVFYKGSGTATTVTGSYALAKDVGDANNRVDILDTTVNSGNCNSFGGFFDGLGHKVTFTLSDNSNYRGYGLFGYAVSGVIQNLNIDVNLSGTNGSFYRGVIGREVGTSLTLKDLYVYVNDYHFYGIEPTTANEGGNQSILLGGGGWSTLTLNNVIVEVGGQSFDAGYTDHTKGYNLIGRGGAVAVTNVFVITNGTTYSPDLGDPNGSVTGIPSRPSFAALKSTDDLSGFTAWDLSGSNPKVKGVDYVAEVTLPDVFLFSTLDEEFYLPETINFTMDDIVSITSVDRITDYYVDGAWVNKLSVTNVNANVVDTYSVLITLLNGKNFVATVNSYTKVFSKLEDFSLFYNGVDSHNTVTGSYALAKDVGDADNRVDILDPTVNSSNYNSFGGFFDGLGHKVTFTLSDNSAQYGYGLFGYAVSGVIQNLNIDVNLSGTSGTVYYRGVIGREVTSSLLTLKDLYVYVNEYHFCGTEPVADQGYQSILLASGGWSYLTVNKLIVEVNSTTTDPSYTCGKGYNMFGKGDFVANNIVDFYIITNGTKYDKDYGSSRAVLKAVPDYTYFSDLKSAKDLSGFTAWNLSGSNPFVKGIEYSTIPTIQDIFLYSTADDKFYISDNVGLNIDDIASISSKDGTTTYYVDGIWVNTFAVADPSASVVETTDILLVTANGRKYYATVNAYTEVFDELSDFERFYKGSGSAVTITGSYALANDIGSNSDRQDLCASSLSIANSFNGYFDGLGHTITFKIEATYNKASTYNGGLFGKTVRGTIKNVNFNVNLRGSKGGSGVIGYECDTSGSPIKTYLENVNIYIGEYALWGNTGAANKFEQNLLFQSSGWNALSMKNVIIEVATLTDKTSGALTSYNMLGKGGAFIASDVYLITHDTNYDPSTGNANVSSNVPNYTDFATLKANKNLAIFTAWDLTGSNPKVKSMGNYQVMERVIEEDILYSTKDSKLFLPDSVSLTIDDIRSITSKDGATVYYDNKTWLNDFGVDLSTNNIATFDIIINTYNFKTYKAVVKSYAGVIDELSDLTTFFATEGTASGSNPIKIYGYYIVIKNLGTGSEIVNVPHFTGMAYKENGFCGVLDGLGHTLKFTLEGSSGLFGEELGSFTIKNLAVEFTDNTTNALGLLGNLCQGNPLIENCFIKILNNRYAKLTTYGIVSRPNNKLVIKNSVIWGENLSQDSNAGGPTISASSSNAMIVWGRATSFNFDANFIKSTNGVAGEGADLTLLPDANWKKTDNKPEWKTSADLSYNTTISAQVSSLIIDNGVTTYTIIIPDDASDDLIFAKNELINFVREASGVTLTVSTDTIHNDSNGYISIGNTAMANALGIDLSTLGSQGYYIASRGGNVYILGNTDIACVFGVYGLLNEILGYEQLTNDIYYINNTDTVPLPSALDIVDIPDIEMRVASWGYLTGDYATRMKMPYGLNGYIMPAGDSETGGYGIGKKEIHNALDILPYEQWKSTHAKWFADSHEQLCFTAHGNTTEYNAMVAQIVNVLGASLRRRAEDIILEKDTNVTAELQMLITLTVEDNIKVCTCSACQAAKSLYGSNSGAVIKMCNDVKAGLDAWVMVRDDNHLTTEKYDKVKNVIDNLVLGFFAYNEAYIDAPVQFNGNTGKYELKGGLTIRDDIGVFYAISDYINYFYPYSDAKNATFRDNFKQWSDVAPSMYIWTYECNNFNYMLHTPVFGNNAFFNSDSYTELSNCGARLIYSQACWNEYTDGTAFADLNIYLVSNMLWNNSLDIDQLTDKWFNSVFREAAPFMKQLYEKENNAMFSIVGTNHTGIPTMYDNFKSKAKSAMSKADLQNNWLPLITQAKNAVAKYQTSDPDFYNMCIAKIEEEWLAPAYWLVYLYGSGWFSGIDTSSYKTEFRRIMGYNNGVYAHDYRIGENDVLLSEFVDDL